MPTPPKLIAFKVTNGSVKEWVKATNITSGGTIRGQLDSSGQCSLNPAKSNLTWNEGDKIHGSISGRINQNSEQIIKGGGCLFQFTNSATTTIASISI